MCSYYGTPDREVKQETFDVKTAKTGMIKLSTTIHTMMVDLDPQKAMRNYYWLGGPHVDDHSAKVTVIHHGQSQ